MRKKKTTKMLSIHVTKKKHDSQDNEKNVEEKELGQ